MPGRTLGDLTAAVVEFRDARDWRQFHTPKDLAISLSLEAAELLENFQWKDANEPVPPDGKARVADELSDVLYWTLLMAHDLGIDLEDAFRAKLEQNARKYPVELAKGTAKKYTEL